MKTSAADVADLTRSVLSVPPLCRRADFAIDREQNIRLLAHLRAGGVSTFMYGGNANLYNMAPSEFVHFSEIVQDIAQSSDWIIPSVGSDYGKAADQLAFLRGQPFPTAMLLPHRFPATPSGVAMGIRKLADIYGKPLIAYVKDDGYVEAADLGRLMEDGAICAIKYAIVRKDPAEDPFLNELLSHVQRERVISGIGERPAIVHLRRFGLAAFTSGSVCAAPRLSTALLRALQSGDDREAERLRAQFLPLEDLRDKHSPLRVLHAAVAGAGIADTGPLLPFLSNIEAGPVLTAIEAEARRLLAANHAMKAAAE